MIKANINIIIYKPFQQANNKKSTIKKIYGVNRLNNEKIKIDFNSPIDISVPIEFKDNCLLAWGQSKPKKSPVRQGD